MHKIFLPLYRYFSSHKPLMYIILTVTTLVFLFFGLQLKYEEDISRLLPSSSVESQLAFTSIELKDKIYIQVTSADQPLAPETLCERTDEFIDLLSATSLSKVSLRRINRFPTPLSDGVDEDGAGSATFISF